MLTLSRKPGERIVIRNTLLVRALEMEHEWVRLEIDDGWPDTWVRQVILPRYPTEFPLFEPRYSRQIGALSIASDRPIFDLSVDDTLEFSGGIFVQVIHVRRSKVSLGIHSPMEVPIHRWETFLSIINEGRQPLALT